MCTCGPMEEYLQQLQLEIRIIKFYSYIFDMHFIKITIILQWIGYEHKQHVLLRTANIWEESVESFRIDSGRKVDLRVQK